MPFASPLAVYAVTLVILSSWLAVATGLCASLFGPVTNIPFSFLGFFGIGISFVVTILMNSRWKMPKIACNRFTFAVSAIVTIVGGITGILLLVLLLVHVWLGPAGGTLDNAPVFQKRDKYYLKGLGKVEEVSETRFRASSASFLIGWHSGVIFFSFVTIMALGWPALPDSGSPDSGVKKE